MSETLIRVLISAILLFALIPVSVIGDESAPSGTDSVVPPPPERDAFTIAILGDRTGGEPEGLKFLEQAIHELNQLNPDFVIHIGDKVQGYTREQDEWLRECEEFKSCMSKLTAPWYPVAGNHDVFTPIRDPGDRTYEELYKKHFGPLYYSFDYKNSHFVIMYTDEAMTSKPTISSKQIEWLRSDLEGANKTNVFIFLHKPVWRLNEDNWDQVHQTIRNFPVRAVIAGHFHAYQKDMNRDGIQYYLMGVTGAEVLSSAHELTGYFHHYNILRVDGDRFKMAVVKLGNVESDDYVLAEDYKKIWNISDLPDKKTGVRGWLWQPVAAPVKGRIEIYVYNPLGVKIPVEARLKHQNGKWSMAPHVLKFDVLPDSSATATATLSSPRAKSAEIVPPELEFEYNYTNARGKSVPVIIRRRVPLRETYTVHKASQPINIDGLRSETLWRQVSPLYNYSWIPSVYERHDAPPKIYLASDGKNLYFFAEVMDKKYSYLKSQSRSILSDTIFFSAQSAGERKDIVIFPFNEDGKAFLSKDGKFVPSEMSVVPEVEYASKPDQTAGYYYCEGKIPLPVLFGNEPTTGKEMLFNAGVVDNDLEAFTYLYTWAFDTDPQYWGILKLAGK